MHLRLLALPVMVLTQWQCQKSHWHWRRISTRRISTITHHYREIQPLREFISTQLTREQISFCAVPHLSKTDQKAPFWSRSSLKTRKHNENRLCSGSLQEVLNEPLIPVQHTSTHGCIQRESPQQRAGSLLAQGLSSAAHQKSSPG